MSEPMSPWKSYEGMDKPGLWDVDLGDIVFKIGLILQDVVTNGEDKMPKHIAERLQDQLDLALMDREDRKILTDGLLAATEETHKAALRAKHKEDLVFMDIVTACRVYGSVQELGVADGIKASIDNIKRHAVKQAEVAVRDAVNDQAPAMYDVTSEHKGKAMTERVMTTAVYVLTEDEMVILEKKIVEAVLTKASGGGIRELPA